MATIIAVKSLIVQAPVVNATIICSSLQTKRQKKPECYIPGKPFQLSKMYASKARICERAKSCQ
jgi:hypothetical protein